MDISKINDKAEYYFVCYTQGYDGSGVSAFTLPKEVEEFVTEHKKDDDAFQVDCIIKGRLVDIKSTEVEIQWKIQE